MEQKTYTFTVKQQELWDAVKKAQREFARHRANGCSFASLDRDGNVNDNCDCHEEE